MRFHRFLGLALLLPVLAGCGSGKSAPTGDLYQGKHVSEWGDAVEGSDAQGRLEAAKVLVKMGKEGINGNPAIPGLRKAIWDEDPIVRGWATVALVYAARGTPFPIVQVAKPKLEEAVESSDEELRAEAKTMLAGMQRAPAGQPGDRGGPPEGAAPPATEKKTPPEEGKD